MADDEVTPFTTATTNYGFVKPDVGASNDVWGGLLNTDLDNIDSTIKGVSNIANAAYPASNPSGYQTAAQVTTAVPVASSTTPLVNGTAAVGTGTTWARADHVHPTDTSGWLGDNQIINGNFAVNQRIYVSGTALATTVYGHDRWKAGPSGCTYTFTAALPDTTITITAGTLTQVIEAGAIAGGVCTLSWTGTAQARVYQGTPTGSYAASPVVTASLTAGTNTIVEFNAGALGKVKLEIGSVATPYPRQSLAKSLIDCQRYFEKSYDLGAGIGTNTANGATTSRVYSATDAFSISGPVNFKVSKRAIPTMTLYSIDGTSGVVYNNVSGNVPSSILMSGSNGFCAQVNSTNVSNPSQNYNQWTASAEL